MLIVHVHVHVIAGMEDAFIEATAANARASLEEPGVLRFDVVRDLAARDRFVLVEVYRDAQAPAAHKETAHYAAWRDAVAPMMASPRTSTKYEALAPTDPGGVGDVSPVGFEVATASQIVFGEGAADRLGELARAIVPPGAALFVTGRDASRTKGLRAILEDAGFALRVFEVPGEPTTEDARRAVAIGREIGARAVFAVGGGSALDLGKAVAALVTHEGDPLDYLEVVGKGQPLVKHTLPFVAVPTTSGTGSEVTKNAVLADPTSRVKVSMRSDRMLARLALVDPLLTTSVPPAVTAATGLDALTQVIEPFVSCAATPFTDGLAREGIVRGARSLRRAFAHGDDRAARTDLATTSLFGGLCLANAKLGVVHGFAGPIGGTFDAPHGAICARLLPLAIETNLRAIRARGTDAMLARFDELAQLLTDRADALADDAVPFTRDLARDLAIPALSAYGLREADVQTLVQKCERASSTKGNPLVLDRAELTDLLTRAL